MPHLSRTTIYFCFRSVHAVVHHQSRLDAKWYRRTITALDTSDSSLIPRHIQGSEREALVATLFAEIVAVVVSSHMLHVALLCLGEREMPPLPKLPTHETAPQLQPSYQDIASQGMLKENKTFRHNGNVSHAPFVVAADYDTKSSAWQELGTELQEYLLQNMITFHPLIALSIAPRSVHLVASMATEISLSDKQVMQPWKELDSKRFCVDGFSRYDCETIMVATAEAYGNAF